MGPWVMFTNVAPLTVLFDIENAYLQPIHLPYVTCLLQGSRISYKNMLTHLLEYKSLNISLMYQYQRGVSTLTSSIDIVLLSSIFCR